MRINSDLHPLARFQPLPVVDSHFHMIIPVKEERFFTNLENVMEACGTEAINVVALTARGGIDENKIPALGRRGGIEENLSAALSKWMYPGKVYAFSGLHYHLPGLPEDKIDLAAQARTLHGLGFDGFKFIEGKPDVRKGVGIALDSPVYDGFFEFVQEQEIPMVYHVADPWRGDEAPADMQQVYGEIGNVLARHPRLQIIFAHFFFLAHKLEQAAELLETYPNLSLDLTPHGGMFADFSEDPEKARAFFIKYQDRIIFGTDNHGESRNFPPGSPLEYWPVYKMIAMRTFLETDRSFRGWHADLRGIALPREVLEKIYAGNFRRKAGAQPRALDAAQAVEEGQRLLVLARRYAIVHDALLGLQLFVDKLKAGL